jgi:hypothetical protein
MWIVFLLLLAGLILTRSYRIQTYRPRSFALRKWEKYYNEDYHGYFDDYKTIQTIQQDNKMGIDDLGISGTYGEISSHGLKDSIFSSFAFYEEDVMYDLGSGIGKAVIQFAYETKCGRCTGIELGVRRHMIATTVLEDIKLSSTDQYYADKINFILGDITTVNWTDATVLFINALCFPEDLWFTVEDIILSSCPKLRLLILGGKMLRLDIGDPVVQIGDSRYNVISKVCASSWDENNLITCYERINQQH